MRLLLDQDVYASTEAFQKGIGHDVIPVSELGMATSSDLDVLNKAHESGRLLITRDRDYGALVFVSKMNGGVLYLRFKPSELLEVHEELELILSNYSVEYLRRAFVVVEKNRHRIRKIARQ